MKKVWMGSVLVLVLALVLAPTFLTAGDMPPADAAALWKYITETSPYQKWGMWPDHSGMQPGRAPHGPFHKVYVNDILLKATAAPVPFGSIEVKESYTQDQKLAAITIMYKVQGFNPSAGDWFWVKYSLDGKGDPAGKVQGCIDCHAGGAKNDYILVHTMK